MSVSIPRAPHFRDAMENLAQFHRRTMLDVVEAMRWDHVWLYERFAQLRMLKQLQAQAQAQAEANV